ncbi:hypothetical protein OAD01_04590, partial [Candidatus Marinimicrobia bacterium]|nr:hypothetical protein [Candidatus Neomarinimicrobiota bacterium]
MNRDLEIVLHLCLKVIFRLMRIPRNLFFIIILVSISNGLLFAQVNNTGAVGSVTIDGKVWNQVSMRPVIP